MKKITSLLLLTLVSFTLSCNNSDKNTTNNLDVKSKDKLTLKATPKPSASVYPETFHPGYKTKLPDGGIYKNKQIIFTAPKETYLETISDKFIDYTNYYTSTGMSEGLAKINKTKSVYVGKGQKIIIDNVRELPPNPKTIIKPKNFEARGLYITYTVAGGGYIFKIAKEMKKLNMNTMIIDAKDMDGHLSYKSEVPLAKEIGATGKYPPIRNLKKLVEMLHKDGFHVVMRQTLFHDELMGAKKPQYAPRSKSNGGPWKESNRVVWVDPSNKTIQDYHLAISKELAQMGVDEIQYDYVRFPAWGNTKDAKYGFDETKIKKHEIITGFLKRQRENLAPYKVLMSADVYGVVAWDQDVDMNITGQKIADMAKYLDILSPMLYPSHFFPPFDGFSVPGSQPYHFLNSGVKRTRNKTLGTNVTIRPWIQAFTWRAPNYSPDYVYQQIKATNDAYSAGWLLWNAGNEYKIAFQGISKFKNKYPNQANLDKLLAKSADKGLMGEKKKEEVVAITKVTKEDNKKVVDKNVNTNVKIDNKSKSPEPIESTKIDNKKEVKVETEKMKAKDIKTETNNTEKANKTELPNLSGSSAK